jgi:hypothetical protein
MNMFDKIVCSFDDHTQLLFLEIMKVYSNILLMPITSLSIHKMNHLHGLTQN